MDNRSDGLVANAVTQNLWVSLLVFISLQTQVSAGPPNMFEHLGNTGTATSAVSGRRSSVFITMALVPSTAFSITARATLR